MCTEEKPKQAAGAAARQCVQCGAFFSSGKKKV
jgi:hypothetical protein